MTDEDWDEPEDEHPVPFKTWQHEGIHFHSIGPVQLWQREYVEKHDAYRDPPILKTEFSQWLAEHKCEWLDWGAFGPPAIKFPDVETMRKFERVWHIPGEQKFMDYLAGPEAKALHDNNARVLAEWIANDERDSGSETGNRPGA